MPDRAPRREKPSARRHLVSPGRTLRGPIAARADAAAPDDRRRSRRGRRGIPRSRAVNVRPRAAIRSSSCTPPTGTSSRSSYRRSPTCARALTAVERRMRRRSHASSVGSAPRSQTSCSAIRFSTRAARRRASRSMGLCELLPHVSALVDYVNVTVGRADHLRQATWARRTPPLLEHGRALARRGRQAAADLAGVPRSAEAIGRRSRLARTSSAVARPLIADPDIPAQAAGGPRGRGDAAVRRLQRGLPRVRPGAAVLGQPRTSARPARRRPAVGRPYVAQRQRDGRTAGRLRSSAPARPASSARLALAGEREVVLFDERRRDRR